MYMKVATVWGKILRTTENQVDRLLSCAERLGCLTRRGHTDAGVTLYSYDAAGNMTQETSTPDWMGRKDTFFFITVR